MAAFVPRPTTFSTLPSYSSNAFVNGLEMNVISTTQFTINPGAARDLISDYVMIFSPASGGVNVPPVLTVDITVVGLNGCYPYSVTAFGTTGRNIYPIYLVSNTDGSVIPSVVIATGNEFLPPGMNCYRRIGFLYVLQGTPPTILSWAQSGSGNERRYMAAGQRHVLVNGMATTYTEFSLSTIQGSSIVPPKPNMTVFLTTYLSVSSAGTGFNLSNTPASDGLIAPVYIFNPSASSRIAVEFSICAGQDPTTGDSVLYYESTNAGNVIGIDCSGFVDSLGPSLY